MILTLSQEFPYLAIISRIPYIHQLIKLSREGSSRYRYYHITVVWCWIFKKLIRWKFSKRLIRAERRFIQCSKWTPLFEMIDLSYLGEAYNNFNSWGVKKTRLLYLGSNSSLNGRFYLPHHHPKIFFSLSISPQITWLILVAEIYPKF